MKVWQKRDVIVVAVLLFSAVALYVGFGIINKGKKPKAEIYYRSELIRTVELSKGEEEVFLFPQNENVMIHLYEDGTICFEKSDCPDQICVRSGRLSEIGESAACLPNELIMKIVPSGSYEEETLDMIQ